MNILKDFIKKQKWEVPLYIIAAGLPLIIYFHAQYTGMESFPWFPNQTVWTDFFLYGKSKCVHLTALLMTVVLIVGVIKKKNEKFGKEWIWILLLGMFQLISAFTSIAPQQSFLGGIEQYESVWVLTGYLVIGAYAYQRIAKGGNPQYIMNVLFIGVLFSCLLGITQLFQNDFWESGPGKMLLVPENYRELRESLRFNFSQGNWEPVYLASYNPNYAGIYLLMILPCLLVHKNHYAKILAALAGVCLLGTMSKTALLSAVFLLVIGIVLFGNSLTVKWKKWMKAAAVIAALDLIVFLGYEKQITAFSYEEKLQNVVCDQEYVRLTYQGESILMRDIPLEEGGVTYEIIHEDGNHVNLVWNEASGEMDPLEETLQGLHFKVYDKEGISYIMFRYNEIPFRFTKGEGNGIYEYVSINGKLDELQEAPKIFGGFEELISGRGYIWSRTLPVIMEHPIFGTGPDTFLLAFPQDDYVVRSNLGHTFFTQILTNAHSLYLHMAEQTGIPSLLCFLIFVGIYLRKSWKLYYGKTNYSEIEKIGAGIFLGVTGYMVCGLTFASSVCTTPIFWLLLGTGMGINYSICCKKDVQSRSHMI